MTRRILAVSLCAILVGACTPPPIAPDIPANPLAPSAAEATTGERPLRGHYDWTVAEVQWAGAPGTATSLFDGRCSVPSDYVIAATFTGEVTHAGRVTGTTSHCSQITWSPQGPIGSTYSDGRGTMVSADGSELSLRYSNGITGVDPDTGDTWFRDSVTLEGLTGLFEGATGRGQEGGRFKDFASILSGTPVPMWLEGIISYAPGKGPKH